MLNLDDLYRARYVLGEILRRTDLVRAPKLNPESDIYLKPENLQITGSFKIRGAYYKNISAYRGRKEAWRCGLLSRQPCPGRGSRCYVTRHQVAHLSS